MWIHSVCQIRAIYKDEMIRVRRLQVPKVILAAVYYADAPRLSKSKAREPLFLTPRQDIVIDCFKFLTFASHLLSFAPQNAS